VTNFTGRNHSIVMTALAYAIVSIERLPEEWQQWSNKEDMRRILEALKIREYLFLF
jgi:hypothetical protein